VGECSRARAKIIVAIEGTTDAFQMSSPLAAALLLRFLKRAVLYEVGEDGADGGGLFEAGRDPHRAAAFREMKPSNMTPSARPMTTSKRRRVRRVIACS